MRPLNIKLSAFGPYADYIEIPMEKLGDRGLYLITGDTGAGKTTIFDAICFALFGEASGTYRDGSMLRSKYAAPETPTEVELTFSHMGKVYTVKRNPDYVRPSKNKKGDGETKQIAKAELTMPDGSVITKIKSVRDKVEEILGINKDQFSQIAMLSQGEFLKLLHASTEDRIKIFRDLFHTQKFLSLQKELETSCKALNGEVLDLKKSIEQYIGGIQVDKDNVLSMEVEKAKHGELLTEDVIDVLDKLSDEDKELKRKLDDELKVLADELELVNQKIGTAETIKKAKEEKKKAEIRLEEENSKVALAEEQYKNAKLALEDKAGIEKQANKIETDFPRYDRVDVLLKTVAKRSRNIAELQKQIEETVKTKEQKAETLEKLKVEQAEYKDTSAEIEKIKAAITTNNDSVEAIRELSGSLDSYFEELSDYEQKQKQYKIENDEFIRLNNLFESMDQLFRNAQAGILAQNLEEGMECPVCGSIHHPRLAELSQDVPSEKELETAKKNADKARKSRDKSSEILSGKRSGLEKDEAELRKKSKKQLDIEDLMEASKIIGKKSAEAEEKTKQLSDQLRKEIDKKERKAKLDEQVPEIGNEISDLESVLSDLRSKAAGETAGKDAENKELTSLTGNLAFKTKEAAQKEYDRLIIEANGLQENYESADKKLNDQKKLITELKTKVAENEKIIQNAEDIDAEQISGQQQELKKRQEEIIKQGEIIAGRLDNNKRTRNNISEKSSDLVEAEKKLRWVKTLSDTANGKLTGKEKVMLETYIQTTYFDRIINRANLRLITMSGAQYELIRLQDPKNVQGQSGLDLGVIDHYNGTQRSVKTLSGGESFLASLSLALGLSDEVQSSAGGIQIDTMFVDEGFGSLDPETLDMAYKALASLIEGNRLVGIISHVADLKERIDRQIVVTKGKTGGSRIQIV